MKRFIIVSLLFVAGGGLKLLRSELSQSLKREFPQAYFYRLPERLDQTSLVIAIGGLRTLTACHLYIQSFEAFEKRDWAEVESLFYTIVALDPLNTSYWSIGAWHLTHNAYYDFEEKLGIVSAERRLMQSSFEKRGIKFLLRGVNQAAAPQRLWVQLARVHADESRGNARDKAIEYYQKALTYQPVSEQLKREYFYLLSKTSRIDEAWELGVNLLSIASNQRFFRLKRDFYMLTLLKSPKRCTDRVFLLDSFQNSLLIAYESLKHYRERALEEGISVESLDCVIQNLEQELKKPQTAHLYDKPTNRGFENKDMFENYNSQ